MDNLWKQYAGDLNSMTDDEVDDTVSDEQEKLKEAQEWLDAVASWKAAGKPRRTPMDNHSNAGPRGVYMGQIMAECNCPTPETCQHLGRCWAMRDIEMLDRVLKRTTDRMSEPQPHNWTGSVFIALIIVALLMLGLSLDVQATVDAVNGGLDT